MRLQPVRFIGHKIGPFDHIELNWHEDSQSTIIVGENGTGKTTLVAAMAACLGNGARDTYPVKHFDRFASSKDSYAYLEVKIGSTKASSAVYGSSSSIDDLPQSLKTIIQSIPFTLHDQGDFFENHLKNKDKISKNGIRSDSMGQLQVSWREEDDVEVIAAAYGSYRDLIHDKVTQYEEIEESPFKDILNPFAGIAKSTVPQWIANQHVLRSLAFTDGETIEAESYLSTIRRIEEFFTVGLQMPIKSQIDRNPFSLKIAQNGSQISIDQLSDGTRSFLSWALDYLSRVERINWKNPADKGNAPGLILVDEIDSHLHPEWQKRVMAASVDLLPHTHIIATSHSPFVVGAADDTQVFHIVKNDEGKLSVESSYDELYGYPADTITKKLFTPSLYPASIQEELDRLGELASKLTIGEISDEERTEHDELLEKLSAVSPWIASLWSMVQPPQNGS